MTPPITPTTDLAARFEAKREECERIAQGWADQGELIEIAWRSRALIWREARDMARADAAGGAGERVRHLKRGTEYEVLGEAEAQVAIGDALVFGNARMRPISDGDRLTVYRGEGGELWVRFTDEFRDGRFLTISGWR